MKISFSVFSYVKNSFRENSLDSDLPCSLKASAGVGVGVDVTEILRIFTI